MSSGDAHLGANMPPSSVQTMMGGCDYLGFGLSVWRRFGIGVAESIAEVLSQNGLSVSGPQTAQEIGNPAYD
jgi:hypothetical protein